MKNLKFASYGLMAATLVVSLLTNIVDSKKQEQQIKDAVKEEFDRRENEES